jgi:hypothetical protein
MYITGIRIYFYMVALADWLLLPIYFPIGELFMPYGG